MIIVYNPTARLRNFNPPERKLVDPRRRRGDINPRGWIVPRAVGFSGLSIVWVIFVGKIWLIFYQWKNFSGLKDEEKLEFGKKEADFVRIKLFTPNSKRILIFHQGLKKLRFNLSRGGLRKFNIRLSRNFFRFLRHTISLAQKLFLIHERKVFWREVFWRGNILEGKYFGGKSIWREVEFG